MFQTSRSFLRLAPPVSAAIKKMPSSTKTAVAASFQGRALFSSEALKPSYDTVLVSTHEPESGDGLAVGVITLNQPKSLNSLADELFNDLIHASRALDGMDDIGTIVVTGKGKAFAAGANIPQMSKKDFATAYNTVSFNNIYYHDMIGLQTDNSGRAMKHL